MNKHLNLICAMTIAGSAVTQASVILIEDDFTTSVVVGDSRFDSDQINTGNWVQRQNSNNNSTDGSWLVSTGALTNDGTADQGAFLLNSVSSSDASLTEFVVSFDYTLGAGSTLYFHSALYTGGTSTTGSLSRISRNGGRYFANQISNQDFNGNFSSAFNLLNGNTPTGETSQALISFAGGTSGTFTQTYDISAFTGINSVADFSHILAAFTLDTAAAGDGAVTIDDFSVVVVPEPSALGLLGLSCVGFLLRRCRG